MTASRVAVMTEVLNAEQKIKYFYNFHKEEITTEPIDKTDSDGNRFVAFIATDKETNKPKICLAYQTFTYVIRAVFSEDANFFLYSKQKIIIKDGGDISRVSTKPTPKQILTLRDLGFISNSADNKQFIKNIPVNMII